MPRQARLDVPGVVYHVMARGIEGRQIFRDNEDREAFLSRLGDVVRWSEAGLYAWALLSNHFHLVLRRQRQPLASFMRRLMTGHAVRYNVRHHRKGHLFQNRYKSIVVEEEPYFLELVRYVHLNPVRAGIVREPRELEQYPYSGHAVVMGSRAYPAQDVEEVLLRFSDQRKAAVRGYRDFVAGGFWQGEREEFRGGGLVRSAGGWEEVLRRKPEDREAADARILGRGEFVAEVLREHEVQVPGERRSVWDVLDDVCARTGVGRGQVLGTSRERAVCKVRREFYLQALEESGAAMSELGRLTSRNHMAVSRAIERARKEADTAEPQ